ncbi:hypothetical protein GJV06_15780 [Enterobacteriaceae bacterium RIT691]|nr:hypothetical protein [Enterobacteriaceae bacterium RIT691]
MFKILMIVIVTSLISGCTSQRPFGGAIYIVNSCGKTIHVVAENFKPWMEPVGGGDKLLLDLTAAERKVVAIFTLAREDQDITYLFSEKGADFMMKISDGNKEKVFHGQQLYRLSVNVTSNGDRKYDDVNYEIRSKEICP